MNRSACRMSVSCHDAKRIMSVFFAYYRAVRFTDALRFSFYAYFACVGPPAAVC